MIFAITLLTIIRELIISGCGLITDCSLSHIAHNCPDLEVLRINGCRRLTSTSLLEVAVHCPNLYGIPPFANEFDLSQSNKDLSAARCRNINEGVTAIARDCKLRQLDLYLIKEVGDSLMSSGKCRPQNPRHSSNIFILLSPKLGEGEDGGVVFKSMQKGDECYRIRHRALLS